MPTASLQANRRKSMKLLSLFLLDSSKSLFRFSFCTHAAKRTQTLWLDQKHLCLNHTRLCTNKALSPADSRPADSRPVFASISRGFLPAGPGAGSPRGRASTTSSSRRSARSGSERPGRCASFSVPVLLCGLRIRFCGLRIADYGVHGFSMLQHNALTQSLKSLKRGLRIKKITKPINTRIKRITDCD